MLITSAMQIPVTSMSAASYRVVRAGSFDGIPLKPGDMLPRDAPVRKRIDMLQILCAQGYLEYVAIPMEQQLPEQPSSPTATTKKSPKSAKK